MSIRFEGLGINLEYVPKSIQIFDYKITILGILLACSMLLGILLVVLDAKRKNHNQDIYLGAVLMAVFGAILGGRLFYVGFSWNLFKNDLLAILDLRNGGMAFYGALFGGMLLVALFCAARRVSFGEIADTLTFGILIVQIFTRLGDFFNRESFGGYTDWLVAMQLPLSSVRASEVTSEMREQLLTIDGNSWIQVHPAFAYEMLWCLIIFFVLLIIRRKKRFSGEIFMRYLRAYGFGRFFIEYLRTDQLWIPETTLPVNMVLSAVLVVVMTLSIGVSRSMAKKRTEAAKKRRQELEAAKKEEEEKKPVNIEELLREDEEFRRHEQMEEEARKAAQKAMEEAEQTSEQENTPEKEETTSEKENAPEETERVSEQENPSENADQGQKKETISK